jgi:SAM-dependent methyltransferase
MYNDKLAHYYDQFYLSKNYQQECIFIKKNCPDPARILDVGCGTGSHILHLSNQKNFIQGVDISPDMIKRAREKFLNFHNVNFFEGSIEDFSELKNAPFDLVISMFNVINHMLTPEAIDSFFEKISLNLTDKGTFIFDCYNSEAVYNDYPKKYTRDNGKYSIESVPDFNDKTGFLRLRHKVTFGSDTFEYDLDHVIWSQDFIKEIIDKYFKSGYKVFNADGKANASVDDYKIKFITNRNG